MDFPDQNFPGAPPDWLWAFVPDLYKHMSLLSTTSALSHTWKDLGHLLKKATKGHTLGF